MCFFFTQKNTSKGWWEKMIGPGAPINTDEFFVICSNVIAGCYGSRYCHMPLTCYTDKQVYIQLCYLVDPVRLIH